MSIETADRYERNFKGEIVEVRDAISQGRTINIYLQYSISLSVIDEGFLFSVVIFFTQL